MLAIWWRRWQRLAKEDERTDERQRRRKVARRKEGRAEKGIGGKRAGHDEDEKAEEGKRGAEGEEEKRPVVRKGRRRENSLPPPTYAAGGSYRHGLGGPWDCQTFARPSVVLGFFIDPRAILSPPTVSTTHQQSIENKTNSLPT